MLTRIKWWKFDWGRWHLHHLKNQLKFFSVQTILEGPRFMQHLNHKLDLPRTDQRLIENSGNFLGWGHDGKIKEQRPPSSAWENYYHFYIIIWLHERWLNSTSMSPDDRRWRRWTDERPYLVGLACEKILNGYPETIISDVVGAVGHHRHITPLDFMLSLRSSLHLAKIELDGSLYCLKMVQMVTYEGDKL